LKSYFSKTSFDERQGVKCIEILTMTLTTCILLLLTSLIRTIAQAAGEIPLGYEDSPEVVPSLESHITLEDVPIIGEWQTELS
jgi:hypothetical protein